MRIPSMKLLHAFFTSKTGAWTPSAAATMCAVAGSIWSWLADAKISRSMSVAVSPASSSATRAAPIPERAQVLVGSDHVVGLDAADGAQCSAWHRQPPGRRADAFLDLARLTCRRGVT